MYRNKIFLLHLFCSLWVSAQTDSLFVEVDTLIENSSIGLINMKGLESFFNNLEQLSNDSLKKVSIVHIGDSHIQADIFSGRLRKSFQKNFGHAGRGLVFPHNLAKSNGASDIRFQSDAVWESQRNIHQNTGNPVGVSGFALFTKSDSFYVDVQVKSPEDAFQTMKLLTPGNAFMFQAATTFSTEKKEVQVPQNSSHTIKSGENLSTIAAKFNTSVKQLQAANGLKNTLIRAGQKLVIPSGSTQSSSIDIKTFNPIVLVKKEGYHLFTTDSLRQQLYLIPREKDSIYALNGLVLENNQPGIVYHTIGVNGAKTSDFLKFPLFFEQLRTLQPDLIIISLGTNESFDKLNEQDFKNHLEQFIASIKTVAPETSLLLTTLPPSLFKKKFPNTFAAAYSKIINENASMWNSAVWDLFSQWGGLYGVPQLAKRGLIAADRVHYTRNGYDQLGVELFEALMDAYEKYKNSLFTEE
jgi:LysM repeat protein/lysophospholipase L1-like esterase